MSRQGLFCVIYCVFLVSVSGYVVGKIGLRRYGKIPLFATSEQHTTPSTPPSADVQDNDDFLESLFSNQDSELSVMEETIMDQTIAKAVKQIVDQGGPATPPPTPLEKLHSILHEASVARKEKRDGNAGKLNAAQVLQQIFEEPSAKEPFDDRKVMLKLQKMLHKEDFDGIFKQSSVEDEMPNLPL